MAVISKGTTFATGDQVTALKLNNLADAATFASGAVDNVSTQLSSGAIIVKDGGVSTAKIANGNVTKAKIENVANMKVLGNTSGSAAAPQEVSILDEDTMYSDSATSLATQQSIKAYIDRYALKEPTTAKTGTFNATSLMWVDLNLSSAVGINKAMVIMEVYGGSNPVSILFRTRYSAIERYNSGTNAGWGASGLVTANNNRGGVITVVTDAYGRIQHSADGSSSGVNYNILAYQELL